MSERARKSERSSKMLGYARGSVVLLLAGVAVAIGTSDNDKPAQSTKAPLVCPPTPDEVEHNQTVEHRISPLVKFVLKNNGTEHGLYGRSNMVLATMVSRDLTAPPDTPSPEYETALIGDFGQQEFVDPAGQHYIVDVNRPPAESLAADPQAADVLICR